MKKKTERISLVLPPALFQNTLALAKIKETSINGLIESLLSQATNKYSTQINAVIQAQKLYDSSLAAVQTEAKSGDLLPD